MNLRLSGRLLARKALLNFIGQAVPLLVGVVTIPFTVQGLGTERFGLLVLEEQAHDSRHNAICAPIAPYEATRREVQEMVSQYGGFILVYVATPPEVCEARDPKGLYAKARAGLIKNFTGIDDPYEPPEDPEVVVDASRMTPEEAVQRILAYLEEKGYISRSRKGE